MNQEVIELLEKAIERLSVIDTMSECLVRQALESLKQQPAAGEFTKNIRDVLAIMKGDGKFHQIVMEEACDRLDRAESTNKDLLEACISFCQEFSDYGRITNPKTTDWRHSQEYKEQIINKFEAAIAKAKKEGGE